ncbi:hypothetical protein ACQ7RL_003598 [Photobacterium damselae]
MNKYCIIVLYNPDIEKINKNVLDLLSQNIKVIIIDNTEYNNHEWFDIKNDNVLYCQLNNNLGLSYAYNLGIKKIEKFKPTNNSGVLFLDQDSDINIRNINLLYETFFLQESSTVIVAGNPLKRDGQAYRSYNERFVNVNFAISSFSIYRYSVFKNIGLFQEDFFIDHIDTDYCHRCIKKNLDIVIDTHVEFIQPIGTKPLYMFGRYLLPIPSTFRTYYQIRNVILSYNRDGISKKFLINEIKNRFIITVLSGYHERDLFKRLSLYFMGIFDGVRNIGGKYKSNK